MENDTNEYIVYSNFMKNDKEAVVIKHRQNHSWGVVLKEKGRSNFIQYYPTHGESFAENVADNFIEGLKQL